MKVCQGSHGIIIVTHKKYPSYALPLSVLIENEDKDNLYIRLCHITPLVIPKADLVGPIKFTLMGIDETVARVYENCNGQTGVFKVLVKESFEDVLDRIIMEVCDAEQADKSPPRH